MVARPSPRRVRWKPGSSMKLRPQVEEMAEMSPMCSTMVVRDNGMMVISAVTSRPLSAPPENRPKTVASLWMGMPIQAALETFSARAARAAGSKIMATI